MRNAGAIGSGNANGQRPHLRASGHLATGAVAASATDYPRATDTSGPSYDANDSGLRNKQPPWNTVWRPQIPPEVSWAVVKTSQRLPVVGQAADSCRLIPTRRIRLSDWARAGK
jgi:hypothetical protein